MMRLLRAVIALVAIVGILGTCDSPSGNSGPVGGFLTVEMTSPSNDDGGIMFILTGGAVDSVRSNYPTILTRSESATTLRVVIGGALVTGKIAELWVPDVRKVSEYSATPVEVAARSFVQRAVTGYTLTVSPPQ